MLAFCLKKRLQLLISPMAACNAGFHTSSVVTDQV